MLHVLTHIVHRCPICQLPLHITVARRRSRCLLGGRAAKVLLIGGGSLSFVFGAEHVCVSAQMEEYHLSVNAAMPPCALFPVFYERSSSSRTCAEKPSSVMDEEAPLRVPSLGKHGHKDSILHEATQSHLHRLLFCTVHASLAPVRST